MLTKIKHQLNIDIFIWEYYNFIEKTEINYDN